VPVTLLKDSSMQLPPVLVSVGAYRANTRRSSEDNGTQTG